MAVYFNLAIDCDKDEESAQELALHFDGFAIETERFGTLKCDSEHTLPKYYWGNRGKPTNDAGNWHKVCVHPKGMMMSQEQAGILDEQNINHVRAALYDRLLQAISSGHQFRSAYFGWEAQDVLGDSDWLKRLQLMDQWGELPIGMEGLVLATSLARNNNLARQLEPFATGYLWWNAPSPGH